MLSDQKIKEIAEELGMGMTCYIHKENHEMEFLPDLHDPYVDSSLWEDIIEKIDENFLDYYRLEPMPSKVGFGIMEDFAETVTNRRMQEALFNALSRRKPFANFKYKVDSHEGTRQDWFAFRDERYQEWVREQLADLMKS